MGISLVTKSGKIELDRSPIAKAAFRFTATGKADVPTALRLTDPTSPAAVGNVQS